MKFFKTFLATILIVLYVFAFYWLHSKLPIGIPAFFLITLLLLMLTKNIIYFFLKRKLFLFMDLLKIIIYYSSFLLLYYGLRLFSEFTAVKISIFLGYILLINALRIHIEAITDKISFTLRNIFINIFDQSYENNHLILAYFFLTLSNIIYPNDSYHFNKGLIFFSDSKYKQAIEEFKKELPNHNNNYLNCLNNISLSYEKLGLANHSLKYRLKLYNNLDKNNLKNENNQLFYSNIYDIARIYYKQFNFKDAKKFATLYLKGNKDIDCNIFNLFGFIYDDLAVLDKSINHFKKAYECFQNKELFNSNYVATLWNIVTIYNKINDSSKAKIYLEKILKVEPENEDAKALLDG